MKRFQLFHPDEVKPIDRGKGIKSIPLIGSETGSEILLTGMSIMPPGTEIPLHTHNRDECIVMLEGKAICEVEGQRQEVAPFDTTFVAAGVPIAS